MLRSDRRALDPAAVVGDVRHKNTILVRVFLHNRIGIRLLRLTARIVFRTCPQPAIIQSVFWVDVSRVPSRIREVHVDVQAICSATGKHFERGDRENAAKRAGGHTREHRKSVRPATVRYRERCVRAQFPFGFVSSSDVFVTDKTNDTYRGNFSRPVSWPGEACFRILSCAHTNTSAQSQPRAERVTKVP